MKRIVPAMTLMIFAAGATTLADTLVLANGRRVQGELVGVFGRDIEFAERGTFNRRVIRVPRSEIVRIEFDEDWSRDEREREEVPAGIPRGMRERQINVTARESWTDTGIDVRAGQQIYFQASGETRWGPNRRDGATGERNSPYNAGRPLPDRPGAALIGRIGERDLFFIGGDQGPFRVRSSGRLYLGVNDDVLTDNSGALRVTVSY
jgi:hypothetical protein